MNKDDEKKEIKTNKDTIKKDKTTYNYEDVKWLTGC